MEDWVLERSTVNQYYYKQFLKNLRKKVKRKRPELWKNGFILLQDNLPYNAHTHNAHTVFSVKKFLVEKQIPTLNYPSYSPLSSACDFFHFPKIKVVLKGTRFDTVPQVKEKTIELLQHLTEKDFSLL